MSKFNDKKYSKRARTASPISKMSFNKRVLGVINKTREIKTCVSKVNIRTLNSSVQYSNGDVLEILPGLQQSTSGYDGRVGNEIVLKKLKIRTIITVDTPPSTTFTSTASGKLIRDMVLQQLDSSGCQIASGQNPFDELRMMRNALGPSDYAGDLESYMRPVNDEAFKIKKDSRFMVFGAVNAPNWAAPGDLREGTKYEEYTIDFGLNGLRLNYTDSTDAYPNNFPYFRIVTAIGSAGEVTGLNNQVGFTSISEMIYTDA